MTCENCSMRINIINRQVDDIYKRLIKLEKDKGVKS